MIQGLNHITISAKDLDASLEFYAALGFKPEVRWRKGAYLTLGGLWLCLSKCDGEPATDYSHLAYTVSSSGFKRASYLAKEHSWKEWQKNTSEGDSLYLLDPSGHKLELHSGSIESRLNELRNKPYQDMVWM